MSKDKHDKDDKRDKRESISPEEDPKSKPSEDPKTKPNQEADTESLDVVEHVDSKQLRHFITAVKSAEQQVGENIIQALQHEGTVAVLTTVVAGRDGQQHVVSAALKPELMQQVQEILHQAQEERVDEEPCVGFHCLFKPKRKKG